MVTIELALSSIPETHRNPLINEYNKIIQNYFERRWSPSELSGGRFSEIVYSIILGISSGAFSPAPEKPRNMESACKALENCTTLNRSLRVLIPRILPVLYEIRNNRNVGHVGGDIDPNEMDCLVVVSLAKWIMCELVRVLHSLTLNDAHLLIESITERIVPLVWSNDEIKRVLFPKMSISDQVLILLASNNNTGNIDEIQKWIEAQDKAYFMKVLKKLHHERYIEMNTVTRQVVLLPPGSVHIESVIQSITKTI